MPNDAYDLPFDIIAHDQVPEGVIVVNGMSAREFTEAYEKWQAERDPAREFKKLLWLQGVDYKIIPPPDVEQDGSGI